MNYSVKTPYRIEPFTPPKQSGPPEPPVPAVSLPDMKFRITSPEQSAAIQEKLFSLGYAWAGVYSEQYVRFTDKPFLYFNRGMIQCSGGGDAHFNAEPHQECVLEGGEFVPVGQGTTQGDA